MLKSLLVQLVLKMNAFWIWHAGNMAEITTVVLSPITSITYLVENSFKHSTFVFQFFAISDKPNGFLSSRLSSVLLVGFFISFLSRAVVAYDGYSSGRSNGI